MKLANIIISIIATAPLAKAAAVPSSLGKDALVKECIKDVKEFFKKNPNIHIADPKNKCSACIDSVVEDCELKSKNFNFDEDDEKTCYDMAMAECRASSGIGGMVDLPPRIFPGK